MLIREIYRTSARTATTTGTSSPTPLITRICNFVNKSDLHSSLRHLAHPRFELIDPAVSVLPSLPLPQNPPSRGDSSDILVTRELDDLEQIATQSGSESFQARIEKRIERPVSMVPNYHFHRAPKIIVVWPGPREKGEGERQLHNDRERTVISH